MIQTNNEDKTMNLTDFDTSKFKLGTLCKRGHDYEGAGQSLRYISTNQCLCCHKIHAKSERVQAYRKQYREENREEIRKNAKKRYEENRDWFIARNQQWREQNKDNEIYKERKKRSQKKYHEKNKEKINEKGKIYHENNRERRKAYAVNYRIKHRDRLRLEGRARKIANPNLSRFGCAKRRLRLKLQADNSIDPMNIMTLIKESKKCCYCLNPFNDKKKVVDHMIPLSKGGLHAIYNLAICCNHCNSRKGSKSYPEWLDCLEPKQRKSAERLYYKRYGCSPIQGVLPLVFEQEDKSD